MHYCVGVEADRKSGKFSKTGKRKFNESGNSTIQQKWKFNNSTKVEIQQFNKDGKTGNSTNQDLSQKQQNGNPMKLHCQEFRCPGEQEFRKTTVCPSGTLPPDIPQIWNGRFCTLIPKSLLSAKTVSIGCCTLYATMQPQQECGLVYHVQLFSIR